MGQGDGGYNLGPHGYLHVNQNGGVNPHGSALELVRRVNIIWLRSAGVSRHMLVHMVVPLIHRNSLRAEYCSVDEPLWLSQCAGGASV